MNASARQMETNYNMKYCRTSNSILTWRMLKFAIESGNPWSKFSYIRGSRIGGIIIRPITRRHTLCKFTI